MSDLALSSMWGIGRFPGLADFITAAEALGFSRFELNHAVNSAMLKDVHWNGRCIPSVHEPCPADISTATLKAHNWLISAPAEANRLRGVAAVRRSVDLACELSAKVVIVHPGQVDIDPELESLVRRLYEQGRSGEPEFSRARDRLVAARAQQAEINLRSVRQSLLELAEYAARRNIRLGLENRYYYQEIPLPDELDDLLHLGCGDVIGYWYDVGHAQALENLGLVSHEEWLRRFAGQMVGVHLHDIIGLADHRPAGSGQINWDMVARYLPGGVLRTCEFQASSSPDQVAAGVRWLVEKGCVPAA